MVARGRRTEREDKEGDKCERRRETRAKKIYGVIQERRREKRETECERVATWETCKKDCD